MKYLKIFESVNVTQIDKFLKITKLTGSMANRGKIQFGFREDIFHTFHPTSMLLGCAKILDTEYENNAQVREIELEINSRQIHLQTKETVLRLFLIQLGYDEKTANKKLMVCTLVYEGKLGHVATGAKNLGDVLDELRKFRTYFFKEEKNEFEIWELSGATKKYNL